MSVASMAFNPVGKVPFTVTAGSTPAPTEPRPSNLAQADHYKFAEVSTHAGGSVRLEWVSVTTFDPSVALQMSLIVKGGTPTAVVLKGGVLSEDTSSDEPARLTPEMLLNAAEGLVQAAAASFAPGAAAVGAASQALFTAVTTLATSDNEGFFATVGDAAAAGAGIGAVVGGIAGIPGGLAGIAAGAESGAAIGTGIGATVGVVMYVADQL